MILAELEVSLDNSKLSTSDSQNYENHKEEPVHVVSLEGVPMVVKNIEKLYEYSTKVRLNYKMYYLKGTIPPIKSNHLDLKSQGYLGISLESLLTFPGYLITPFLNPTKAPIQVLGIERQK